MSEPKTPNEQAWWDKTWRPFKYHITLWPREAEVKQIRLIKEQIEQFIDIVTKRDDSPFHHRKT